MAKHTIKSKEQSQNRQSLVAAAPVLLHCMLHATTKCILLQWNHKSICVLGTSYVYHSMVRIFTGCLM